MSAPPDQAKAERAVRLFDEWIQSDLGPAQAALAAALEELTPAERKLYHAEIERKISGWFANG